MKTENKEVVGILLMYVVGGIGAIGLYYLGMVALDPFVIAVLIGVIFAIEKAMYKWIRINFNVPETIPDPQIPGEPSEDPT